MTSLAFDVGINTRGNFQISTQRLLSHSLIFFSLNYRNRVGHLCDLKEKISTSACRAVRESVQYLSPAVVLLLHRPFQEGFVNASGENVHGSLLVVAEALKYTGDFMIPRFKEVCKSIMALKDHRAVLCAPV